MSYYLKRYNTSNPYGYDTITDVSLFYDFYDLSYHPKEVIITWNSGTTINNVVISGLTYGDEIITPFYLSGLITGMTSSYNGTTITTTIIRDSNSNIINIIYT